NVRFEADLPVPDAVDPDGASEQSAMLRAVAAEAVDAALGVGTRSPGPVHLNLPYREPLGGDLPSWLAVDSAELATEQRVDLDAAPVETDPADEPSGALYQGGGGIGEADVPPDPEGPFVLERGPRTIVLAGA